MASAVADQGVVGAAAENNPPPRASLFKRLCRVSLAAFFFGFPLGCAAPFSPLIRLVLNKENYNKQAPRLAANFSCITTVAVAAAYASTVEWGLENRSALEGFMPYVSPFRGISLTCAAFFACHVWFPGCMALTYEPIATKMSTYRRLTLKSFIAYAPVHVPYFGGVGLIIGFVLWPFRILKDRAEAERLRSLQPVQIHLNLGSGQDEVKKQ